MKNCIVCLDLTNFDEHILKACNNIVGPLLGYKKMEFVNVINDLLHPEHTIHQMLELKKSEVNLEDKIKGLMEAKTDRLLNVNNLDAEYAVLEGRPYRELVHRIEVKEAGLTVVGCKSRSSHSGITPKRLAHNLNTDMLFVPESKATSIQNILVPVDFSDNCFEALELAVKMAQKSETTRVTALHIMNVSLTHAYNTVHYSEYKSMVLDNTQRSLSKFMHKLDTDFDRIESALVTGSEFSVADNINDYVENNKVDLIIMGAKSHSMFRNFIIGSTTENLINLRPNTPLLIKR